MHIAFLTFEFPDARPGGVGSYTLNVARSLASAGHHAHIFTLSLPPDVRFSLNSQHSALSTRLAIHETPDLAERITANTLPGPLGSVLLNGGLPIYKLAVGALLADNLRQIHAITPLDIIEAPEYEALGLPLMLDPIPGVPIVTQIHLSSAINRWAEAYPANPLDDLTDALERSVILAADGLYAATANIAATTRRLLPFDRPAAIIPYPVSLCSQPTPAPTNGPILYVGRLQRRKGVDVLAAAADIVLRRLPHATFRIAGSDTTTSTHQSMRQVMTDRISPDLQSRFTFLGELSASAVQAELQGASFTVAPSIAENFANTAVDAMAAGRPVIYATGTGLDEVVADAGLAVSPLTAQTLADAMIRLHSDPALLATLAARAAHRAAHAFPLAQTTAARIAFYQQAIDAHHSKSTPPLPERLASLSPAQITAVLQALARLVHVTAGGTSSPPSPGHLTLGYLLSLQEKLHRPPTVYLFGAGRHTVRLLAERHLWESRDLCLTGIIDDHPRFAPQPNDLSPKMLLNTPVFSSRAVLAQLAQGKLHLDAIILSTDTLTDLFLEQTAPFRAAPYNIPTPTIYNQID